MVTLLRFLLWAFARCVLSLRYRIRLRGEDRLRDAQGPFLVLPNHPGYIDPPIVLTTLFPYLHPRPLLYEGNFKNPVLYPVMLLLDAARRAGPWSRVAPRPPVPPRRSTGSRLAARSGRNVILWPAGRVQPHRRRCGSASARTLSEVLRDVPEAKLLLVRTRGVWGSRFSYGWNGKPPAVHAPPCRVSAGSSPTWSSSRRGGTSP
ncbi:MAG: hypothetical protein U0736_18405 [Gemmataceae bacterium]